MTSSHPRNAFGGKRLPALSALLLAASMQAAAGPGAHGPGGEHLDAPAAVRSASALPRISAASDAFELLAELRPHELSILVDRYNTNEPVFGAKLEVASAALKATAAFRAEQGDYAVTDAAMLKALAAPGEHALVFTLLAGKDSDLLDGTLVSTPRAGTQAATAKDHPGHAHGRGGRDDGGHGHSDHGDHGHGHHALERAAWIGAALAALGIVGGLAWWRQRRREAGTRQGGL